MKPRKGILTLAAITALFSAGGCDLNDNVCVYGPPPDYYDTGSTPAYSETKPTEIFDPSENIPEEVYGPPSYFGGTEEEATEETAETAESFDPAENIAETVYGPPVTMEESTDTSDASDTVEQEEKYEEST